MIMLGAVLESPCAFILVGYKVLNGLPILNAANLPRLDIAATGVVSMSATHCK